MRLVLAITCLAAVSPADRTYIREMAAATANLDHRPVIDKPKPNPAPACKQ